MKKEEVDFLGIKKVKEGKDYNQIKKEISQINNYQENIKTDKKLFIRQSKVIEEQSRKIDSLTKKLMSSELNSYGDKKDYIAIGDLDKILSFTTNERVPKQELRALCKLEKKQFESAITFLKKYKLIKEEKDNGLSYYQRE